MGTNNNTKNGESKPGSKPTVKIVKVTFRGNRSREIKIGRDFYRFTARETKEIPYSKVIHPDFIAIRGEFIVKE